MNLLLQYLIDNGLSKQLSLNLISHFKKKYYSKKSIILLMGENTHCIYFILKGLVRGYYLDESGNEVTKCFAKENNWCCLYNMLTNSTSNFYIETLEDSILAEINVDIIKDLLSSLPELHKLYSNFITNSLIANEKRTLYFQNMTAKERYLLFLKENTDLVSRVNQEYIASYIGITKTSLSRLKKDL